MPLLCDMTEEEQDELRDRFAIAALQGILSGDGYHCGKSHASEAYEYADEMMEARDTVRTSAKGARSGE